MKKKTLLIITILFAFALVGCSKDSKADETIVIENSTTENIEFDSNSLVTAYCEGTWDGSFISNEEHCASIENGKLFIDCNSVEEIPDMGPYEDCYWYYVKKVSDDGTWVYDQKTGLIELWSKGTRFNKILLGQEDAYHTSVFVLNNCIVSRYGESLTVYSLTGATIESMDSIVDCYLTSDGILCSDFEHKNYSISLDGSLEELTSSYVRFPREQETIKDIDIDTSLIEKVVDLYYNGQWDGSFKKVDNNWVALDYYGNIIVNNNISGHLLLDPGKIANDAANIYLDKEIGYILNGSNLVVLTEGNQTFFNLPSGDAEFVWIDDEKYIVQVYHQNDELSTLCIVTEEGTEIISDSVLDCNCAYDTLYFLEGDTVYSLDWTETDATPEIYFEGAYAVSPHSDETEGALVPEEQANYSGYGYYNIFSPYGE